MNSCCNNLPARLLGCLLIAGCSESGQPTGTESGLCDASDTPIIAIQGKGFSSPLEGSETVVRGMVTLVKVGEGFYLESGASRTESLASKALFVADAELSRTVEPAQEWAIAGRVAELGSGRDTLTAMTRLTGQERCGSDGELPRNPVQLPLTAAEREALEGMRLVFSQPLLVNDVYNLSRGELTLSADGELAVPTETTAPGAGARQRAAHNRAHSLVALLPGPGHSAMPVGSRLNGVDGLLGHDGRNQRFLLGAIPETSAPPDSHLPSRTVSALRIVSANLLNFFNGDGRGGGFPNERGAENPAAFKAQSERIAAAVEQMQPDLLAVQELENDGFGPNSAAESLRTLLNRAGQGDWAVIDPGIGRIGGDVITVGLFYRQDRLVAEGPAALLDGPEFRGRSRHPLAQRFRDRVSGQTFLLVVNHLKSKGRCPNEGNNADRSDGQGCWNAARVAAVEAQVPWLQGLAEAAGTANILIMGDLNAWRKEDPIARFRALGLVDLVEHLSGLPQHTYMYWGQMGTLDYAFASPEMAAWAVHARNWNVNARWPRDMELPVPWLRFSDHDPVVVDFDFSQAETSH